MIGRRVMIVLALVLAACGTKVNEPPPPPPCEQKCIDEGIARSVRETAKLAYNLTLQGKPVGPQDATTPCPLGGTVHVYGTATSNAVQGATEVSLTYELDACAYLLQDDAPQNNYRMNLTGVLTQKGIIAVQPTATTALNFESGGITFEGTVYEPPVPAKGTCPMRFGQNGNNLSGLICDRAVGFTL